MFDTHCHLTSKRLRKDLEGVLERARVAGVSKILVPGMDIVDSRSALDIADKYDNIWAAMGVHPEVKEFDVQWFDSDECNKVIMRTKLKAIGEIGLDETCLKEVPLVQQKERFQRQIRLAISHQKSLIIHNRGMTEDVLTVLKSEWSPLLSDRTVFHCCEWDERLLEFAKVYGIFIGVDGDVTYKLEKPDSTEVMTGKQEFIKKVPVELLVLETDAPYLLPEPLLSEKKYPNEPANVKLIAEKVAELKGLSVEEIDKVTTENGKRLFGLPL